MYAQADSAYFLGRSTQHYDCPSAHISYILKATMADIQPTKEQASFIYFIRTQGVVGLAVGLMLGGAVSTFVNSFIKNLINPILGIALGQAKNLTEASFSILNAKVMYGAVILDAINFVVITALVYFCVTKLRLNRLDKPKN